MSKKKLTCDTLVIGSGVGGATTAMILSQAGQDVILAEEGEHVLSNQSNSSEAMDLKYRNGGLNVSMGKSRLVYHEGCCVGGLSEMNHGLLNPAMTATIIPNFIKSKGRLLLQSRVSRLYISGNKATEAVTRRNTIRFKNVFVCGGAVQTPLLLRRSGIKKNVGDRLYARPTIKVVARFADADSQKNITLNQIAIKASFRFDRSFSSESHLALWLAGNDDIKTVLADWERLSIFSVSINPTMPGKVRGIPFIDEPWVTIPVNKNNHSALKEGLRSLVDHLKQQGASQVIVHKNMDIVAEHLCGSVPMGEDRKTCAVDSFGYVHGLTNVICNDASIIPESTGDSLQPIVMAMARRNAEEFLRR